MKTSKNKSPLLAAFAGSLLLAVSAASIPAKAQVSEGPRFAAPESGGPREDSRTRDPNTGSAVQPRGIVSDQFGNGGHSFAGTGGGEGGDGGSGSVTDTRGN